MAGGRITYLIYAGRDSVECGVISYGAVGTVQVIVDGARQPYAGNIELFGKDARACQRAVAAYHHQGIDAALLHVLVCMLSSLGRLKLAAACCLQYGTAALDDVTHVLGGELLYLIVDETLITTEDSHHPEVIGNGCSCHRTYCCVHTRGVATAGQYPDSVDLSHISLLFIILSRCKSTDKSCKCPFRKVLICALINNFYHIVLPAGPLLQDLSCVFPYFLCNFTHTKL